MLALLFQFSHKLLNLSFFGLQLNSKRRLLLTLSLLQGFDSALSLRELALNLLLRVLDRVLISDDESVLLLELIQSLFGFLLFLAHPLNHFLLLGVLDHRSLQLIA